MVSTRFWTVLWKLYLISVWIQKRWFLCQKWWKRSAIWQTLSVNREEQTLIWNDLKSRFLNEKSQSYKMLQKNYPSFREKLMMVYCKTCNWVLLLNPNHSPQNLALIILGKTRKTCLRYVLEGLRLRLVPIPGYCPLTISDKYPRPTTISTHDEENRTDTSRLTLLSLRSSVCKSGRGGSAKLSSLLFFTCSKSE